jgi:malate permease and related proteins
MTQLLSIMLNVISPIMLVMGIAFIISMRFNPDPKTLSVYLIYLFTPSLVFRGIYKTELPSNQLIGVASVAVGVAFTMALLGYIVARFMKYKPRAESSLMLTVVLVNAANYGIPLNTFAFGEQGANVAIVYYVAASLVGNIFGVFLASRGSVPIKEALLNVLKVPIAYAAILGLIFNIYEIKLPLLVERSIIDIAANASIPMMLALLGLQLARVVRSRREKKEEDETLATNLPAVGIAVGMRLLIAPFVALALATLLGLSDITFKVAVVESSMPTAVLASALATQFGGDARYVSLVTLVATLASMLTLSVLLLMLGGVAI